MINLSDNNIPNLISIETFSLNSALDSQKALNRQVLIFIKKLINEVDISLSENLSDVFFTYLNNSISIFKKSNRNINLIKELLDSLNRINTNPINKAKIEKYNQGFAEKMRLIKKNTGKVKEFVDEISSFDFSAICKDFNGDSSNKIETFKTKFNSLLDSIVPNSETNNSKFIEHTLIISDINKKVILPYTLKDIKRILEIDSDYSSVQDIVDSIYTKPISYYKFSAIARFKEAYSLIINKEHGSKKEAFSLATELFFNYNLHPAIITACKSLDELDIYLACLETNTLEDFHFFNIKYEITPVVVKKLKSAT